jgi:endo-alpha-1,4-polygalactosaminidase (GH114 family)
LNTPSSVAYSAVLVEASYQQKEATRGKTKEIKIKEKKKNTAGK